MYEAKKEDISAFAARYYDRGLFHEMRGRAVTFYTSEYFWLHQGDWKKAACFARGLFPKPFVVIAKLYSLRCCFFAALETSKDDRSPCSDTGS